jgi:uncharacterized damage-inducible protein DinB
LNADYFRTLYDYHYWARDRVLAAADGMTEDEYAREMGFTYKSIRGMLMHTMTAEIMWFARARGNEFRQPLWQILTLVYSHAIQHRSEAAEALTLVGRSPGNLDLMVYIREQRQ